MCEMMKSSIYDEIHATAYVLKSVLQEPYLMKCIDEEKSRFFSVYMHSVDTAIYAGLIADRFYNNTQKKEAIIRGAILHDIGKLSVEKSILEKPGKLTKHECEKIKKHTVYGYNMIKNNVATTESKIILTHHEKLDGSGYPYGISEIPFETQIVTIADMYDALTSERSYKRKLKHEESINILRADALGGKISSELVEVIDEIGKKCIE